MVGRIWIRDGPVGREPLHYRFSGGNKGLLFGFSVRVNLVCVVASVSLIRRHFKMVHR